MLLLTYIVISCQSKDEKRINNDSSSEKTSKNLYEGKWFLINKEKGKYYHCTDDDRFFEVSKDKIYDHTSMEDSSFNIDHIKNEGDKIFLYIDKQESSYYTLNWIDKNKGIISYQFNSYEPSLFMIEKNINNIENRTCLTKTKGCELNNLSNRYKFTIETEDYSNEKEQKYPISAWIIVTDKQNKKSQEIHFEPNSWTVYKDLPCQDFIVKDFNFDGLEDFAMVWDEGGNTGKLYEYYFQDKNGDFSIIDSFPLQHGMLAEDISIPNKTITTQSIVGCCYSNLNIYKLKADGKWVFSSEQQELKR